MKQLAKNPQLKSFFFENFNKVENPGSKPKPSFMDNHEEAAKHVQEDKKITRWTALNGGIWHLTKRTGQTQFSTKFTAYLSFMPQKKLIVTKETRKTQKQCQKTIYLIY